MLLEQQIAELTALIPTVNNTYFSDTLYIEANGRTIFAETFKVNTIEGLADFIKTKELDGKTVKLCIYSASVNAANENCIIFNNKCRLIIY